MKEDRIEVRASAAEVKAWREMAERHDQTLSQLVRELLNQEIEKEKKVFDLLEKWTRDGSNRPGP